MSSRLTAPNVGAQPHQGFHDLVGILGVQYERDRVEATELFEQGTLALHNRQRRRQPDVAQAEHRAAVADDRHQPVGPRIAGGQGVIGGDRATHLGHAGGVGDRQGTLGVQRCRQADGKLAAYVRLEGLFVGDDDLRAFALFGRVPRVLTTD